MEAFYKAGEDQYAFNMLLQGSFARFRENLCVTLLLEIKTYSD